MFKEKVNTWMDVETHDGQQAITLACWPMANGAKNKKTKFFHDNTNDAINTRVMMRYFDFF